MTEAKITTPDPEPGLYLSIRVDQVKKVRDTQYGYASDRYVTQSEVLCEANEQRFSPFVMAAMLRALADEINPTQPARIPNF